MRLIRFLLPLLALQLALTLPLRAGMQSLEEETSSNSEFFDGTGRYAKATSETPAAEDKARLLADLKARVDIQGTPEERAALDAILTRMMDSRTARQLAVQFINEDARTKLSFEVNPRTKIFVVDGRKEFRTSGGNTDPWKDPPEVHLNKAYMEASTERAPGTLAHEMLGHALESKRAKRYGVEDTYLSDENEEANAGLIGWTVDAELGNRVENGWAWVYMDSPAKYHKQLKMNLPYYAGTLSNAEMKSPLTAFQARLSEVNKLLARLPLRRDRYDLLLKVVGHLPEPPHKMDPGSLLTVQEEINASRETLPGTEQNFNDIKKYLERLLASYAGPMGEKRVQEMAEKSKSEYFKEKQKAMQERQELLSGYMLAKPRSEHQKPPSRSGQVTWDQLENIWDTHQKSVECPWRP